MNECVFCKIAKGEVLAHVIYNDNKVLAFLDKHPINPGHVLVIPTKHEFDFFNLDNDTYHHLMDVVKKLASAVKRATNPKKVGLIVAGFDVPHTHLHIIPMHEYHDVTSKAILESTRANPTDGELEKAAKKLKGFISSGSAEN